MSSADFLIATPVTTERYKVKDGTAAAVLTKGKRKRVVPQPKAVFARVNGTVTIQSARKGETVNFPVGEWHIDFLPYK